MIIKFINPYEYFYINEPNGPKYINTLLSLTI